jgi:hypothetical protein
MGFLGEGANGGEGEGGVQSNILIVYSQTANNSNSYRSCTSKSISSNPDSIVPHHTKMIASSPDRQDLSPAPSLIQPPKTRIHIQPSGSALRNSPFNQFPRLFQPKKGISFESFSLSLRKPLGFLRHTTVLSCKSGLKQNSKSKDLS